jgi:hypothetical protein
VIGPDVIAISLPRSSSPGGGAPKDKMAAEGLPRTAADFIAGPENRLAGAAAQWLLDRGERTYSPLVLHGPSGI